MIQLFCNSQPKKMQSDRFHEREPTRIQFANLPTPLLELKNLAKDLSVDKILIKRDDMTGVETTGNKIRKLEYVVAEAIKSGSDTLVTNGGFQSNHCRASAAIGATLGLKVRLILRSQDPNPALDGNLFLDHLFGAHVSYHSVEEYKNNVKDLVKAAMDEEYKSGRKPYFFPVGASIPLGCWGYIRCMHELIGQLGRDTVADIFVTVGSAGTQAGLMIGRALFGLDKWKVIGIPVSDSVEFFRRELRELTNQTVEEYGLKLTEEQLPINLIDGFIGDGYAIPYQACIDTIKHVARREGIALDPTYTGKGMTGMLESIRNGNVRTGAVPVFIHTGKRFHS